MGDRQKPWLAQTQLLVSCSKLIRVVMSPMTLRGVRQGAERNFDLSESDSKLQVVVFYPADWDPECQAILSAFSALSDQFSSCHATLFGCSTDCLSSHISWLGSGFYPTFPLLSDPSGQLADRFGLYNVEVGECQQGVVFLSSTGEQLELINSSLEAEDLAAFCLDLAWRAAANEDFKACNLSNYVQDFEKQLISSKSVSANNCRERRSRFLKKDSAARARGKSSDPLKARSLHRMEERLSRGYF